MKLGYSTWGMPTIPVAAAIDHVARLGYRGVELNSLPSYDPPLDEFDADERARLRAGLEVRGLELASIAALSSLAIIDPAAYLVIWTRLQHAVDLAVELTPASQNQPAVVATTLGGKPHYFETLQPVLLQRLGELVSYAARRGVIIAIEPHVGAAIDRPERALWLLEQIKAPNLKINFDDSHFAVQGITIDQTVPALAPHTVHTHVKDFVGQVPHFEFVVPGEGEYDLAAYLRAMAAAGYDGFITAEVSVMAQRKTGYDPLVAAGQSYTALTRAFTAAGLRPA